MTRLGFLTPVELLQSQIQSVVGEFLSSRALLTKLTRHSDPDIVDEANKKLAIQAILENELTTANKIMDNIKTGAYTLSDVAKATAIMYGISEHNKSVQKLVAEAGGVPSGFDIPWSTVAIVAGLGVGAYMMFGKRK